LARVTVGRIEFTAAEDDFVADEATRLGVSVEAVLKSLLWEELLERQRRYGLRPMGRRRPQAAVTSRLLNAATEALLRTAIRRRRRAQARWQA
jgi:hypothetical protein